MNSYTDCIWEPTGQSVENANYVQVVGPIFRNNIEGWAVKCVNTRSGEAWTSAVASNIADIPVQFKMCGYKPSDLPKEKFEMMFNLYSKI